MNRSSGPPPPRPSSVPAARATGRPLSFELYPQDLVSHARRLSKAAFTSAFRDSPFLIVRLERADDPLSLGLAAAATSSGAPLAPNPDALAFATNTMSFEEISARMMTRD